MKIVKINAEKNLRIVEFQSCSFSVQFLYSEKWVTVADAENRQDANAAFKSFAKSAATKKGSQE